MKSIFDYADEYNFEKIRECEENGEDINQVNKNGESVFTIFMNSYYSSKDFLTEKEYEAYYGEEEDKSITEDWGYILKSSIIPLENRRGNIKDKLDWFIQHGADINYRTLVTSAYGWKDYGETALVYAVANLDYSMTKYLLEHGANPKQWVCYDKEIEGRKEYDTFLFDHLDIEMFDSLCYSNKANLILNISGLFAKYIEDDYSGLTLTIDHKERIVSASEPKWRY